MTAIASDRNVLSTAKGGIFLAGGSFFEFASRLVIAFMLARTLGVKDYGLYVLSISVAGIFTGISLLGLDDAVVRYVAIMSGRRDRAGLWGTLQIGFGVSAIAALIMGGVLFFGARPIAEGLFNEPRLTPLLHILAVVVPFLMVSNLLAGTARGFRRMDYAAFAENVVQSVVRMVLLAVLALAGNLDVYAAAVIFGISDVAATVTLIALLNRHFPLKKPFHQDARRDVKEVFGFALPLWLSGLLRQFRRNIEVVLLGALSAASSVGIFAIVNKVNLVGHVFLLSILVAVKPILAQLHDRGDREELSHVYITATRWTLTLNMPFFLIMVLYPEAILSVFGHAFVAGATALVVLAFAELANAGTGICGPMIDMTGHTKIKFANSVLWTVLLVGGGAVLIPRWGVLGAATASLIAISAVNILCVVEVWFFERLIPFDRSFWKPLAAGLGALISGTVLRRWMPVGADVGPGALQGAIVSTIYVGMILLFGLAPEERLVIRRLITKTGLFIGRVRVSRAAAGKAG
jgi:O-antigen/teichoic acid export membrane protein